ncbi:phosphatidylserine synthase [Mesorhizobium tianshanense]|uniref:CDP-diacylglycerol--serine O-phosphatidyltransferase n=1 Tax=Mesorhizobium tianshanense TaxID=39844 RepID=A0A562NFL6_9HYPH|nr:CDP-alcohol phosphatidyltransferase family protein [Mesorhizobium tianshanense]TWI30870.1 CDP-diacylglycerol--serine O-phosphatidyltransferase [Mesorhizobium tianshanense]GLS37914.1 phosphatidylserine synthase [Mesorhizobium tianshanense]
MFIYLSDRANQITMLGLLASGTALYFAQSGKPELAIAAALWAVLADHFDGVVAKRTKNRSAETANMGKSLDGFADLLYGAVIPAAVLMQIGTGGVLPFVTGLALILAGALRLSYFSNFGMSAKGYFTGVPLSYDVPLMAVLMLISAWIPVPLWNTATCGLFLLLAVLHVLPIAVPSMNRTMYAAVTVFAVVASIFLAYRGFSAG